METQIRLQAPPLCAARAPARSPPAAPPAARLGRPAAVAGTGLAGRVNGGIGLLCLGCVRRGARRLGHRLRLKKNAPVACRHAVGTSSAVATMLAGAGARRRRRKLRAGGARGGRAVSCRGARRAALAGRAVCLRGGRCTGRRLVGYRLCWRARGSRCVGGGGGGGGSGGGLALLGALARARQRRGRDVHAVLHLRAMAMTYGSVSRSLHLLHPADMGLRTSRMRFPPQIEAGSDHGPPPASVHATSVHARGSATPRKTLWRP